MSTPVEPQSAAVEGFESERVRALAAQPAVAYDGIHRRYHDDEARGRAREGLSRVFGRDFELTPPIDWRADPYGSRSWRYRLHTLEFLDVVCQLHEDDGDEQALRMACDAALDWVRNNPRGGGETSDFAWYDMAAALRAPLIGYLAQAAPRARAVSEAEAEELLDSALDHGHFLADDANYTFDHNHGLYQDEGLLLLARYLGPLPEAQGWSAKARRRVVETIRSTVSERDAVHLEHSPAYHCAIVNLMRRLRTRDPGLSDELAELAERMDASAGWLVTPAGNLPPVGDTDPEHGPKWLLRAGARKTGIRGFFKSGYGVVKTKSSYLLLSCGYHNRSHKHADELSFVLEEDGVMLVGEAGRFAYEESDPRRRFARSPWAHNGVVIDGKVAPMEQFEPYGSGVEAVGSGSGWFAIEAQNPLSARAGIEHRRLLLHRPGVALLVLDELTTKRKRTYSRLLHLGPQVACRLEEDGWASLEWPGGSGWASSWGPSKGAEVVRGRREPGIQGWYYPHEREEVETDVLVLESRAASTVLGLALGMRGRRLSLEAVEADPERRVVRLRDGEDELELSVSRTARRKLLIEQAGGEPG